MAFECRRRRIDFVSHLDFLSNANFDFSGFLTDQLSEISIGTTGYWNSDLNLAGY